MINNRASWFIGKCVHNYVLGLRPGLMGV